LSAKVAGLTRHFWRVFFAYSGLDFLQAKQARTISLQENRKKTAKQRSVRAASTAGFSKPPHG